MYIVIINRLDLQMPISFSLIFDILELSTVLRQRLTHFLKFLERLTRFFQKSRQRLTRFWNFGHKWNALIFGEVLYMYIWKLTNMSWVIWMETIFVSRPTWIVRCNLTGWICFIVFTELFLKKLYRTIEKSQYREIFKSNFQAEKWSLGWESLLKYFRFSRIWMEWSWPWTVLVRPKIIL